MEGDNKNEISDAAKDDQGSGSKTQVETKKYKILKKPGSFSGKQLLFFALIFAAIGSYFLYKSFAAAPIIATVEAENMAIPSSGPTMCTTNCVAGTSVTKTIDGNLSESDWNVSTPITKCVIGTTCAAKATWGAQWDSNYLYVGYKVLDNTLKNDSTNPWDDDSVEFYIDPNADGGTTYDAKDKQLAVRWHDTVLRGNQASSVAGVKFAQQDITGGYTVEMAIPWSSLGVTPTANNAIKLDAGVNDDTDGGARNSQAMTYGTSSNWNNPSGFGALTLAALATSSQPPAQVVDDSSASGGKAMELLTNTTVSGVFTTTTAATSIDVIAKATVCSSVGANMIVKIDGNQTMAPTVSATTLTTYSATLNLAAGTHTLAISFTNDFSDSTCNRNLFVDVSKIYGAVAAPTLSFTANPTTITTGQSSTLTWSSTNVTSCTASGAWTGSKATSGTASTGALSATSIYNLSCTGAGGTITKSVTVIVGGGGTTSAWPKYGISDGSKIMVRSSADQDFEIGQNKAIGAQIMRLDYYQASTNDPVIQKALNAGFEVELVISGTSHAPGPGTASVVSLANQATSKWKGKVKYYEVFNEPDLNGYTADTYVPYLKAVYTAIKTADPNAIVWHGGVWDCNQANTCMIDWLDREYQLGAKNYFDAYNFHCYGNLNQHGSWQEWDMVYGSGGAGFYDSRNIRSVMNANGDQNKPIVCTEGGENSNNHGLTAQADDVTYTLGAVDGIGTGNRKLKTAFIYTMMNDDVPGFGLLDDSRNKRPAWTSYYNAVPH